MPADAADVVYEEIMGVNRKGDPNKQLLDKAEGSRFFSGVVKVAFGIWRKGGQWSDQPAR